MHTNVTNLSLNITTFQKVADYFNISVYNETNPSEVERQSLFDLYEVYRRQELNLVLTYKYVAYVLGSLIILTNLMVVISSGLILRKGQEPKSTYLILGNVSLADTLIGISIMFDFGLDNANTSNPLCVFQIGLIVCPVMVSIFSVGLIAIDRYIYILHGLYYRRWFNATRVRIAILFTWMISLVLGFLPATGWTNKEVYFARCSYIALFPNSLTLFNAFLSLCPIALVAILYSIILIHALKNVQQIKKATKNVKISNDTSEKPGLRIYRGNYNTTKKNYTTNAQVKVLKRCASFNCVNSKKNVTNISIKSNSINDLCDSNKIATQRYSNIFKENPTEPSQTQYESNISIYTIKSDSSASTVDITKCADGIRNLTNKSGVILKESINNIPSKAIECLKKRPPNEPSKLRAVTVVMLTSGSFIISWTPYFVTIITYLLCEEKLTNPQCKYYRKLITGPLVTLAFLNSVLNPLIYAWWHKGFQRSIKMYFQKYFRKTSNKK